MPVPIVYSENYEIQIPEHPWKIGKYQAVYEKVLSEGLAKKEDILLVDEASEEDLLLAHTWSYIERFRDEDWGCEALLSSELEMTNELARFFWTAAEGTIVACSKALTYGAAAHIGGGFHHAFAGYASGFCVINDIAIGIRKMQKEKRISRALVVDLDVHQGDGTAKIFEGDASVFTFSMHQRDNFPYRKQQSSLDIELENKTGDKDYLTLLEEHLPKIIQSHKPELIIYVAGADPFEHDALGGLSLTMNGLKKRDEFVASQAFSAKIPIVSTFAGGYAANFKDTVQIHANTIESLVRQASVAR